MMLKSLIIPLLGGVLVAMIWQTAMPYIDTAAETLNAVAKISARK